jgi:hypothetical protein
MASVFDPKSTVPVDDLDTDLDQLLAKTCQRPLRNRLWSRERAEEVPEIVS